MVAARHARPTLAAEPLTPAPTQWPQPSGHTPVMHVRRSALPAHRPAGVGLAVGSVLLVGCILLAGAASVTAQSNSPSLAAPSTAVPASSVVPSGAPSSAATDQLVAGLLQASDLPAGLLPVTEVLEGTDYDIDDAAFAANDGVRIVSRTWGSETDAGTSIVFDFRMQFPTPEAASAYLAAALPTLSESDTTGLRPVTEAPIVGDETHVYGLETRGDSGIVTIRDYLFRVGPVVAKVLAGGADLTVDQADALARAAADHMQAAGPPPPGSPRPPPTSPPSESPGAPLPSGDLVALLLPHIPDAIASTCTTDDQRLWEGELVTLVCSPTDADVLVTYSGFDTAAHMGTAYQSALDTIDLANLAASCDQGTYTGSYQVDGEPAGQITCWSETNGRAIMWSDDRLSMLSVAVSASLDPAGLYLWWLTAGPNP
jgi:hypothetical protein